MVNLRADVRLNLKQEWGNHSGKPSDSDYLDRPADKGHYLRRLAPALGIGVGTWICLHNTRTLRHGSAAACLLGIVGSNPAEEHGWLSLMCVVCCQVQVSASGWSLIQGI